MDLAGWNQRLRSHFAELTQARDSAQSVFALEHGLSAEEVDDLSKQIRAHVSRARPRRDDELPWVVYAAEIGYRFSGDEYWQTFQRDTPGWIARDRDWLRDAFVSFHRHFRGAVPSGAWASQFSIIGWPITHAILPRDLQQQLARILYEVRHSFSAEVLDSPEMLGRFIAARSWSASARFQNLAHDAALLGQIAAALVLGRTDNAALLHPLTLQRITEDVDREQRGRAWLRGARRVAEERARVRGPVPPKPTPSRRDQARAEVQALGIEPSLVLRPIAAGTRWEVSLEIPDLSHLPLRFPQAREVLADSRCTVAGATGRPLVGGRCLHGPQRVVLGRWPRPDELLLKFDPSEAQLEYLLRTECLIRPGSSWLFRVASDGLAYESRAMRVRAGQRYVLVSNVPINADLVRATDIACEGVFGATLELPTAITPDWERVLRGLGITQAKSIEVWPAGLGATAWDGEGYGEWLASETPILGVRCDHQIDELHFSMATEAQQLVVDVSKSASGAPVFVELPNLSVGTHELAITTHRKATSQHAQLKVLIRMRDARPWSPGATPSGPLIAEVDPARPSLEQLWEGRVALRVLGPVDRRIRIRVKMFTRADAAPTFEHVLEDVALPLTNESWLQHVEALQSSEAAQRAYDAARICDVEFVADELGTFALRCERKFAPLRWSLRRSTSGFTVHLHDDVAADATPRVERFAFEHPASAEALQWRPDSEYSVPRVGGLYVATLSDFTAAIVVPPNTRDFRGLQVEPQVDVHSGPHDSVLELLRISRLWANANLPGDILSAQPRRLVLRALVRRTAAIFGGHAWAQAESGQDLSNLKRCISSKAEEKGVGAKLDMELEALSKLSPEERAHALALLAARFKLVAIGGDTVVGPDDGRWLAEFALRVASEPTTLEAWAGEHVAGGIVRLIATPTLSRAARFVVIAVERHWPPTVSSRALYAGWEWKS